MYVGLIVCIHLIVGRQDFVGMSIVPRDVGRAWSMIAHSIVTGALHIVARRLRRPRLSVIPVVKKTRKHVNITSITTSLKKRTRRLSRRVQSREKELKKLLEVLNMSPVAADEICLSPKLLSKE